MYLQPEFNSVNGNLSTTAQVNQIYLNLYRADESTEILGKGRNIRPAEENLRWIGSV